MQVVTEGRRIGERTGCPTRVLHTTMMSSVLLTVGAALKHAAAYLFLKRVLAAAASRPPTLELVSPML